jgi:hypothetical protein
VSICGEDPEAEFVLAERGDQIAAATVPAGDPLREYFRFVKDLLLQVYVIRLG